jgi:hypothetical protein
VRANQAMNEIPGVAFDEPTEKRIRDAIVAAMRWAQTK